MIADICYMVLQSWFLSASIRKNDNDDDDDDYDDDGMEEKLGRDEDDRRVKTLIVFALVPC